MSARSNPVLFHIGYTAKPQPGCVLQVEVPSEGGTPSAYTTLRETLFTSQHGRVHLAELGVDQDKSLTPVAPRVENINREVFDARRMSPVPNLASHGFECIPIERKAGAPNTQPGGDPWLPDPKALLAEIESAVKRSTGADHAIAFTHARRTSLAKVRQTTVGTNSALFFHTDYTAQSWPTLLPELVERQLWSTMGPPGIPLELAQLASKARRRAVVTAWVYLGPEATCRGSHAVFFDSTGIDPASFAECRLVSREATGSNYRLLDTETGQTKERFFYFDAATPNEAMCFYSFDSQPASWSAGLPAATLMHAGAEEVCMSPDQMPPARESVDVGIFLVWD